MDPRTLQHQNKRTRRQNGKRSNENASYIYQKRQYKRLKQTSKKSYNASKGKPNKLMQLMVQKH